MSVTKPSLLVVDDEPQNLRFLNDLLSSAYQVFTASGGRTALEMVAQLPIDLVLLDVMMPDMNGFEVLRCLRAQPETAELPVIMVSALAEGENVAQGLQQGANDYITKPLSIPIVVQRIHTQLMNKAFKDERQRMIENLQAAQQMKDHLLRIASHDLKGPLMNARLGVHLLKTRGQVSEVTWLQAVEVALDSMQAVVEDFVDTAALVSNRIDLRLESVCIADVVENLVMLYRAHAEEKEIDIMQFSCDGQVQADSARFQQSLGNLISNAVKYSPPQSVVSIWTEARPDVIRIYVADQGPGIPPDEYHKLFTQFGKLSNKPTGGESSTGMGLWIVKHLIQLQGGQVGVEQPAEGGSAFWIDLPLA